MRRSRALVHTATGCALLLGLLGLTGCGSGNPRPAPAPSATATTSATATASTETPPPMPAEAKGTSEAAAKAFVRHYLAVFSYAARTGDVSEMKALAASDCQSCRRLTGRISSVYARGGHASGKGYQESRLSVTREAGSANLVVIRGSVIQFAQRSVPAAGASPTNFPRGVLQSRFEVVKRSDGWLMRDWALL